MLLMPALLGLSFGRSLRHAPSRFSHAALAAYYRRQRPLDVVWFGAASVWLGILVVAPAGAGGSAGTAYLQFALGMLVIGNAANQLWIQRVIVRQLEEPNAAVDAPGPVIVTIDDGGYFIAAQRDIDLAIGIKNAGPVVMINASLMLMTLLLIGWILVRLGALGSVAIALSSLVIVALWLCLRVLLMDLAIDTWPGTATPERLRRTYVYYVQMFEQWVVHGVLLSLMLAMFLAPVASMLGYVPLASASFALWSLLCIGFATAWNKLVYPAGRAATALPLPMGVNRYSAQHPTWAYFVTTIHVGMVMCLVAGILAMN